VRKSFSGNLPCWRRWHRECRSRLQDAFGKAGASNKHPKHFLFFRQTSNGQAAADDFLRRLKERTKDLDAPVRDETVQAQLAAIQAWGQGDATKLGTVQHPVLVVNGDDDVMVPSFNSFELARRLPTAQLSIFLTLGTAVSSNTTPPSFSRHSPSCSNETAFRGSGTRELGWPPK